MQKDAIDALWVIFKELGVEALSKKSLRASRNHRSR